MMNKKFLVSISTLFLLFFSACEEQGFAPVGEEEESNAPAPGTPSELPPLKSTVKFNYTGADQTYTVPSGVTYIRFKIWGAGGGAGYATYAGRGGGGAYVEHTIPVTEGDVYTIRVGQGGTRGLYQSCSTPPCTFLPISFGGGGAPGVQGGGGGGGMSAVLQSSNFLAIAGGGGGGAMNSNSNYTVSGGGAGGANGQNGQDGQNIDSSYGSGAGGGSSTSGGVGGARIYLDFQQILNPSGSYLTGASGNTAWAHGDGGAGGGGFYGGGTGGGDESGGDAGGGGGGSSYPTSGTNTSIENGNLNDSANSDDEDYEVGIGSGGQQAAGGNGLIAIKEY